MPRLIPFVFVALLFSSCAGSRHFRNIPAEEPVARYLELGRERSIATFHFPRGLYSLDSVDDDGYYYRSLRGLVKHSFAGPTKEEGGIFVGRRKGEVRGYVIWAGGRTKIGNLSRAPITYRGATTR